MNLIDIAVKLLEFLYFFKLTVFSIWLFSFDSIWVFNNYLIAGMGLGILGLYCYQCVSTHPGCSTPFNWLWYWGEQCPEYDDKCVKIIERKGGEELLPLNSIYCLHVRFEIQFKFKIIVLQLKKSLLVNV